VQEKEKENWGDVCGVVWCGVWCVMRVARGILWPLTLATAPTNQKHQVLFLIVRRVLEGGLMAMKYPGKLHKMVHDVAAKREEATAEARQSIRNWEINSDREEPRVKKMVARHFWGEPFGELVRLILTRGCAGARAVLQAYLTEWAEGWGSSWIAEKGNLEIREAATRMRSSKQQLKVFQWSTLQNRGMIQQFGVQDVEIRTSIPAPRAPGPGLFEVTSYNCRNGTSRTSAMRLANVSLHMRSGGLGAYFAPLLPSGLDNLARRVRPPVIPDPHICTMCVNVCACVCVGVP
jgi:hypothetical protein